MTEDKPPLESLYPFLHGKRKNLVEANDALINSVKQKVQHSIDAKQAFFDANGQALVEAAQAMATVYRGGHRFFSMGNGGSSCDAAHFAVEFSHPVTSGRPALPAINLSMDTAMISAVANDVGIEHVFSRQLDCLASKGDGLIGFSTSGHSQNLLKAYQKANEMGMITFGLVGGDGGKMATSGFLEHCLVVNTDSIHRVQEVHVASYHILWDLVHTILADDRGRLVEASK